MRFDQMDLWKMDGFTPDPEEEKEARRLLPQTYKCTPELLEAFIKQHLAVDGKMPTLYDYKKKFGGLLGPWMDYCTLIERGTFKDKKFMNGRLTIKYGGYRNASSEGKR